MYLLSCLPKLVFQKDGHEIEYLDKYRTLHLSWSGYVSSETYMQVLNEMLRLAQEFEAENWLIDARDVDFMELGEKNWTEAYFTRDVLHCPLRKVARLASYNFENESYISSVITKTLEGKDLPYKFCYLPDANAAIDWFTESQTTENDRENEEKSQE